MQSRVHFSVLAIVVSIPYGVVADRCGCKKVMILAMVGCLLSDIWVGVMSKFIFNSNPLKVLSHQSK